MLTVLPFGNNRRRAATGMNTAASSNNTKNGQPSQQQTGASSQQQQQQAHQPAAAAVDKPEKLPSLVNVVIKGKWQIHSSIGKGAFGEVYAAIDLETKQIVAIKVENPRAKKQVLKLEISVLRKLQDSIYIPKFFGCGRFTLPASMYADLNGPSSNPTPPGDQQPGAATTEPAPSLIYSYMVMQVLGSNISDLRRQAPNGKFSIFTSAMLAQQMLRGIENLHKNGILHRDIKPGNFCLSNNSPSSVQTKNHKFTYSASNTAAASSSSSSTSSSFASSRPQCYLIDFGLSRRFIADGKIREARSKIGFRGTARYASIAAHKGDELGMADDLWSLFYVVIEFLKGNLPWKGKEKEKIGELKIELTNLRLVDDLPASMADLYTYLSKLAYEDRPDYDFIYNCFAKFDGGKGAIYPGCNLYDWEQPKVTSEVVVATASATAAAVVESGGVTGSTSAMGGQDSTVKKMFGNGASSSATVAAAGIGAPSQQGNSSNNFFSHPQPLGSGSSKRMVTRQDSQNKFILSASSSMERIKTAAGVAAADDTMAVDSNRKNDNYLSFQQSPLINDSQSMNRLHHPYNNSNQEFNQSYDSGLSQMAVNTVTSGNNNNTMASRSCLNLLSSSNNNNNNGFSFQPQLQHMDSALSTPVLQSPFTNSPINAFYSSQQHGSQPSLAEFAAGKLWVDGSRGVGGGAGGEVMMDVDIEDEEEDKMLMKSDNRHGDNKFSNFGHQEDNNSEDKSLPSINRSRSPEFPRQFQEEQQPLLKKVNKDSPQPPPLPTKQQPAAVMSIRARRYMLRGK